MLVKRFKDFLFESESRIREEDGYYYKIYHKIDEDGGTWEYILYKNKKECGQFLLMNIDRYLYDIDLKSDKYKDILEGNIMLLFGIRSNVKGMGVRLMTKVISETRRLGYENLILYVSPDRDIDFKKLLDFYEHFGFEIFKGARTERFNKRDMILMNLKIK